MNKTVKEAYKILEENGYGDYIPELEINEICEINDVWDGEGEISEYPNEEYEFDNVKSYSYSLGESNWINYIFAVIKEKENELDTIIKIVNIELL